MSKTEDEGTLVKPRSVKALPLTLIIFGSPIWASLIISAVAIIISLYAVLWSLVVAAWSVFAAFVGCGFGFALGGVILAVTGNAVSGVALIGGGIFLLGLSIFTFFGSTVATKGAARLSKLPFVLIKNL